MNTQAGQRHKLERMQKWRDDGFSDLVIAAEFDLPVDAVRRLLAAPRSEKHEQYLLRETGKRLLKSPPREILAKVFDNDLAAYSRCVLMNFPEAA